MALTKEQSDALLSNDIIMKAIRPKAVGPSNIVEIKEGDDISSKIRERRSLRETKKVETRGEGRVEEFSEDNKPSRIGEAISNIKDVTTDSFSKQASGDILPIETVIRSVGSVGSEVGSLALDAGAAATKFALDKGAVNSIFPKTSLLLKALPEDIKDKTVQTAKNTISSIIETETAQSVGKFISGGENAMNKLVKKNPRAAANIAGIFGILELIPAFKALKLGKNAIKKSKIIIEAIPTKRGLTRIEETIRPELNRAEARLAQSEGRIIRGKKTRLGGTEGDIVKLAEKEKKAAKVIEDEIYNAQNMNDAELLQAIKSRTFEMKNGIKPELEKIELSKDNLKNTLDDWENVKEGQMKQPDFKNDRGAMAYQKQFDEIFKELLKPKKDANGKFRKKNLNDLWDARIELDKIPKKNVKKANDLSDVSLQNRQDMWIENRNVMKQMIEDVSSEAGSNVKETFSKMSSMLNARENIITATKINLRGEKNILERNAAKIIGGTVGVLGAGAGVRALFN